jgi:MFS family permease
VGGASVTGAMLLAARAVQGAAAALLVSSTKSLLVTVYTGDKERSRGRLSGRHHRRLEGAARAAGSP